MNLPNLISFIRIPILFLIVLLMVFAHFQWAGTVIFCLYVLGALTDWLDGYLARLYSDTTDLGKLLDALVDKIFVIGLFISLVALGTTPLWTLFGVLLILTRELLITGLRLVAAAKGRVLAAEKAGKLKTFSQIFTIGAFLFYRGMLQDYSQHLLPWMPSFVYTVGIVSFSIAVILTISSGLRYFFKYWGLLLDKTDA